MMRNSLSYDFCMCLTSFSQNLFIYFIFFHSIVSTSLRSSSFLSVIRSLLSLLNSDQNLSTSTSSFFAA